MFIRINSFFSFILVLSMPFLFTACGGKKKDPAVSASMKSVTVGGMVIYPRTLENKILANGNLIANEEVELRSEIPGRRS